MGSPSNMALVMFQLLLCFSTKNNPLKKTKQILMQSFWTEDKKQRVIIDNHLFYRENGV